MPATQLPEFCRHCGNDTQREAIEGRTRAVCTECGVVFWQNPKPASAVAVVDDDSVLLVRRGRPPAKDQWSLPAGYLELDESHRECAIRELAEETKVEASQDSLAPYETLKIRQRGSEFVVVVVYVLDWADARGAVEGGSDVSAATFWSEDRIEEDIDDVRAPYQPIIRSVVRAETPPQTAPKSDERTPL